MPLVHLYRTGHCFHRTHTKFYQRYKLLNGHTWPHYQGGSIVEGIALIIRNLPLPSAEFTIGSKHVFVRSPRTVYELEQFRNERLHDLAILIQKTFRMYSARKGYKKLRHSQMVIASVWRTWRVNTVCCLCIYSFETFCLLNLVFVINYYVLHACSIFFVLLIWIIKMVYKNSFKPVKKGLNFKANFLFLHKNYS